MRGLACLHSSCCNSGARLLSSTSSRRKAYRADLPLAELEETVGYRPQHNCICGAPAVDCGTCAKCSEEYLQQLIAAIAGGNANI